MGKYLALIRRSDFTDLFKYGSLYLNYLTTASVGEDWQHSKEGTELLSLFQKANSFESSFTYLVIVFTSDSFSRDNPLVSIEEVSHVYPLDREAKKEFEISFDDHIKIEDPIWENAYEQIQRFRTVRDCEKGAGNVLHLYGLKESLPSCKDIIDESILNEAVSEVYSNRRPSGSLPIWVYLMRYERHSFFPPDTVGYFMDVVYVVCNFLRQHEVYEEDVISTGIYRFLDSLPRDSKMKDIFTALERSDSVKPFLQQTQSIEPRIDFLKVAVLFLYLRKKYSEGFVYEPELQTRFKDSELTRDYFPLASYLLGLILGHDKTYSALYENLPLLIYKSPDEMKRLREQQEYERWRAAEEMRRMDAEKERQRMEKYRKGSKYNSLDNGTSHKKPKKNVKGGDQKQPSFPVQDERTVKSSDTKQVTGISAQTEIHVGSQTVDEYNSIAESLGGNITELSSPEKTEILIQNPSPERASSTTENKSIVEQTELSTSSNSLFPEYDEPLNNVSIPVLPCTMGKLKLHSRTELCKNPKPVTVNSPEKYISLYNQGWREKRD